MRKLPLLGAAIAVVAIVAIGAFFAYSQLASDDPNLATEAPAIPTSTAGASGAGSSASPIPSSPGAPAATAPAPSASSSSAPAASSTGVQRFVVDSSQSLVKFVVKEDLRGVPDVTTVGETKNITGEIHVSKSGLASTPKSTFKVDMNTLVTDSNMRDNFIRRTTLQTSQHPTAEFTIESVQGFPANYTENAEVQLTLTGTLTIRGVNKPVTWQVKARQAGNVLTATADTDIKMTDFGMSPPDVGFAKSKDEVHLQVVLVSNRVAV